MSSELKITPGASKRPLGSETSQKENIWFVERTATGWSQPKPVGPAVNAMSLHWQVAVSNSGTVYFGGRKDKPGGLVHPTATVGRSTDGWLELCFP